ncbi:hypothetical protein [Desulfonema magnum]|uniref:Uncharacterized protein n=1 Tax=Desulfonema magnum TaxID=45655 RepID=A0A975BVW1_9BACT|nr:hypothetical protein [Desulfonema magnum]QTA92721.1 Uncharacterized protein dnm_088100 [Desulfonema magnum]
MRGTDKWKQNERNYLIINDSLSVVTCQPKGILSEKGLMKAETDTHFELKNVKSFTMIGLCFINF